MKRVSRGLCVLVAINISSATTCLLAASYLGSLIQMESYPEYLEPGAASAPLRQSDLWQHPALEAALDESRARDLAPPLLAAPPAAVT